MNEQSLSDQNGLDDLEGLLSMGGMMEFDMGNYTVKHLPGSERLYKLKMDRPARLMETMGAYRKEQRYCDVVFRVNDSRHPAHRVVLASASAYFASMFGHSNYLEARIKEDIDFTQWVPCPTVMDLILDFIYTSQVQLNDKVVRIVPSCSFMQTKSILLGQQELLLEWLTVVATLALILRTGNSQYFILLRTQSDYSAPFLHRYLFLSLEYMGGFTLGETCLLFLFLGHGSPRLLHAIAVGWLGGVLRCLPSRSLASIE